MPSNNKNESDETGTITAFLGIGMIMAAVAIMAVLTVAAMVLTIVCFFAWNKPRRIGKLTIMPDDARAFVLRGIAGAFLIPASVAFLSLFLDLNIDWNFLPHLMLAGYVIASIGVEVLAAQEEQQGGGSVYTSVQPQVPAPPAQRLLPRPDPQAFRFASWDDEENGR